MKVGIIGSGFGLYGLLPAFNSIPDVKVVAICGKKSERLLTYCKSIQLTKVYTNWEEMLEKEQLDAVAIAVVPSAQYKIVKVAIKKGIHIFAEKPLTSKYEEAKELLLLATKKKLTTTVDFIFPEIEEWQKAKELLDKKVYGELKHISVNWDFLSYDIKNKVSSWKTDLKEGGGVLSFYGSHSLYYIEYFVGTVSKLATTFTYSKESKNGAETGVDMVVTFKNKATGQVHISCNTIGLQQHKLVFFCEKGTLVLESESGVTENFTLTIHTENKKKVIAVKKLKTKKNEDERVRTVEKLVTRFVEGVKKRVQVTPSFKEGVRVQELIEKIRNNKI